MGSLLLSAPAWSSFLLRRFKMGPEEGSSNNVFKITSVESRLWRFRYGAIVPLDLVTLSHQAVQEGEAPPPRLCIVPTRTLPVLAEQLVAGSPRLSLGRLPLLLQPFISVLHSNVPTTSTLSVSDSPSGISKYYISPFAFSFLFVSHELAVRAFSLPSVLLRGHVPRVEE